jgi:hypothetical protein
MPGTSGENEAIGTLGIVLTSAITLTYIIYKVGKKNPFIIKNKYIIFIFCCLLTVTAQKMLSVYIDYNNSLTNRTKLEEWLSENIYIFLILLYAITIGFILVILYPR